jgi:uncharacterized membrane protein YfcA
MLTSLLPGLVVGLILALTGAGGGILAVPLLVFGTSIGMAEAGPIGLMAVGMAAALGAILGLKAGIVRYRAAMLIALAGMLLSPLGLWIARQVDNRWLSVLFGLTLLYVAAKTFGQAANPAPAATAARAAACVRDTGSGRLPGPVPVRALLRCREQLPACCRDYSASVAVSSWFQHCSATPTWPCRRSSPRRWP